MAHTPGPWDYVEDGPDYLAIMAPGDFQVASVGVDDNSTADARLISAAPELLEILKQVEWTGAVDGGLVCPWCGARRYDGHYPDCPRQLTIAKAEAAP